MCKSINLEEILNSDLENLTTDQLATRWIELKKAEKCMQDMRYEVEAMLHFKNVDDERLEGTIVNNLSDGNKLKEKRSLTYKVDAEKIAKINKKTLEKLIIMCVVKTKYEIGVTQYKSISNNLPDLYKICQSFVSVKPAKPSFSVESI